MTLSERFVKYGIRAACEALVSPSKPMDQMSASEVCCAILCTAFARSLSRTILEPVGLRLCFRRGYEEEEVEIIRGTEEDEQAISKKDE